MGQLINRHSLVVPLVVTSRTKVRACFSRSPPHQNNSTGIAWPGAAPKGRYYEFPLLLKIARAGALSPLFGAI